MSRNEKRSTVVVIVPNPKRWYKYGAKATKQDLHLANSAQAQIGYRFGGFMLR
jgi:hypothetical protein